MKRSSAWHSEVSALAEAYGYGANGMGLQYTGGAVSARHLSLWYAGGRAVSRGVFGNDKPTETQVAAMARDVSANQEETLMRLKIMHLYVEPPSL